MRLDPADESESDLPREKMLRGKGKEVADEPKWPAVGLIHHILADLSYSICHRT
jgi:hypothetical protein